MAPAPQDTAVTSIGQEQFQKFIRAQMREAVRLAFSLVLEEEITVLIGANPYERTATRRDHRNGYYDRDLDTSVGHREKLYPELRGVFYQESRIPADQAVAAFGATYEASYPTAIECLKRDLDACLTFYAFPRKHWRTIRTTNVLA